ncbi:hypothetical protein C8F01DRAFT_146271 [Mycena amicta]|nr:hypothetical protein C8F01DRAFT_146271 [Mycena amicta]
MKRGNINTHSSSKLSTSPWSVCTVRSLKRSRSPMTFRTPDASLTESFGSVSGRNAALPLVDIGERSYLTPFIMFTPLAFFTDRQVVLKKPGFLFVLVRAWRLVVQDRVFGFTFMEELIPSALDGNQLEEVIAGAGGTLDSMARLIALHIKICLRRLDGCSSDPDLRRDLTVIRHVLVLATRIDQAVVAREPTLGTASGDHGPFVTLLCRRLCARDMTALIRKLGFLALNPLLDHPSHGVLRAHWEEALLMVLPFLWSMLVQSRAKLLVALKSDVLLGLASCLQREISEPVVYKHIKLLLNDVLQPYTFLSSANPAIRMALAAAAPLASSPTFRQSPSSFEWDILWRWQRNIRTTTTLRHPSTPPVMICVAHLSA